MSRVFYGPQFEFTVDGYTRPQTELPESHRIVLDVFQKHLSPEWEIYVRPYLNGLRPDFVLLNPKVGIGVFEVRDWDLQSLPKPAPENDGQTLWADWSRQETRDLMLNPMRHARSYRDDIYEVYCPRLPDMNGDLAITAGVILPFAKGADALRLLAPFRPHQPKGKTTLKNQTSPEDELSGDEPYWLDNYFPITGREAVEAGRIGAIFPDSQNKDAHGINPEFAKDLRGWLVEPDFALEQRKALPLDKRQRELAETRTTSGFRRIRGPAGSGKSLVLAARAARLLNEGKSVLICTYNITLWHYLLGLVMRGVDKPGWMGRVRFTNFHRWCKTTCYEVGWSDRYSELWENLPDEDPRRQKELTHLLEVALPALATDAAGEPGAEHYDAILVDEGQDYRLPWWNALREVLRPGGEMLLVADKTQDVYGTARSWTEEAMGQAGFSGGPWAELRVGYRMPPAAEDMARGFAERFLPKATVDLPDPRAPDLADEHATLRWVQCTPEEAERMCVREVMALKRQTGKAGLASADITFLVDSSTVGRAVAGELWGEYRMRVVDTFPPLPPASLGPPNGQRAKRWVGMAEQRKKTRFFMCDARVKATTLHSFKGWESPLIVIYVSRGATPESLALIYTGLTRLKRSGSGAWLTVVCSAPELEEYGQSWLPREPVVFGPIQRN